MDYVIVRVSKKAVKGYELEIDQWMYHNNILYDKETFIYYVDFYFNDNEEAMAFKLRWS